MTPFIRIAALAAFALGAGPAQADEHIVGRVHGSEGHDLRLCFDQAVSAGTTFDILRHTTQLAPKGQILAVRSDAVATLRIDAPGPDHCAAATVLRGHAHALDWAVPAAG